MIRVTENLAIISDLLAKASADAGRTEGSVKLLAVSKKQPVSSIIEAADAGQRDFGENFVQEGLEKIAAIGRDDLIWHFIGHLQTNKTRAVAENFDWVHTIDKLKTARRLSEQRPEARGDLNVCIQVNIDDEMAKTGIAGRSEALDLAQQVAALPRIRLRGLMCLPAIRETFDDQRKPFARLRALLQMLRSRNPDMDTLSMGMTADYRAAIFEGSTIVRIGTALFGPRK